MFFYRYEIHIQAFVHFMNGKFTIFDPHLHKITFKLCTQIPHKKKPEKNETQIEKYGT